MSSAIDAASPAPPPLASQLEKDLERAKKRAASAERLYKAGILAKVDAEKRTLRVVHLEAEFAHARLEEARNDSAAPDSSALAQLRAAAESADLNLQQAELAAAAINLKRQRMLLALGSGRSSDVARAEEKLASLKKNPP